MARIIEAVVGTSLLLATSVAAAGAASPGSASTSMGYPQCEVERRAQRSVVVRERREGSAQGLARGGANDAQSRIIDEYLSFHARVTEDGGKFTLMPWSGLRTHAN